MNKEIAILVKELALSTIKNAQNILLIEGVREDKCSYEKLHRAVAGIIGDVEIELLSIVYEMHPELDDLAWNQHT